MAYQQLYCACTILCGFLSLADRWKQRKARGTALRVTGMPKQHVSTDLEVPSSGMHLTFGPQVGISPLAPVYQGPYLRTLLGNWRGSSMVMHLQQTRITSRAASHAVADHKCGGIIKFGTDGDLGHLPARADEGVFVRRQHPDLLIYELYLSKRFCVPPERPPGSAWQSVPKGEHIEIVFAE